MADDLSLDVRLALVALAYGGEWNSFFPGTWESQSSKNPAWQACICLARCITLRTSGTLASCLAAAWNKLMAVDWASIFEAPVPLFGLAS